VAHTYHSAHPPTCLTSRADTPPEPRRGRRVLTGARLVPGTRCRLPVPTRRGPAASTACRYGRWPWSAAEVCECARWGLL